MNELKTLKDLSWIGVDGDKDHTKLNGTFISENDLKAEAIKWIKEDYSLVRNKETHIMLERWKNRFNLTDEDLK